MRVKDYIEQLTERFEAAQLCYGHGTDNAGDEACYLVFGSLGFDWQNFDAKLQRELSEQDLALLEELAGQRIVSRRPVAYLVGTAWFAGYPFKADSRALVPRSPIAELLENRLEPLLDHEPIVILDLCCGGGCIGIAAAHVFPESRVDLADISGAALELATENVQLHGLQNRVQLVQSDLFAGLAGRTYDLILSNPPYVGRSEFENLPEEFAHEPSLGLFSEDQGLQIPLKILREAADHLTEDGVLILEVGYSQDALTERCPDVPFLWLEFEHGGQGVLMLDRSRLLEYRDCFN